jgi:hypothetical protein
VLVRFTYENGEQDYGSSIRCTPIRIRRSYYKIKVKTTWLQSFILRKLGLACFGAALPLPQQFQNTHPPGIPPQSERHDHRDSFEAPGVEAVFLQVSTALMKRRY